VHRYVGKGALALCAVVTLAACANGEMGKGASSGPAATPAPLVYPAGVLTTAEALPATRGIYGVPAGGAEQCCWVDNDVRFFVPVAQGAKSLHLDVVVPAVPAFAGKKQTVTQLDPAGKNVATRDVPIGAPTSLTFPLPPRRSYGLELPVHLRMSTAVVPHDVGGGPDVRRLAIIVTHAYAR
jgi:hypothetical protein